MANKTVKVEKGDTLSALAKESGVSLKSLIQANPQIKNPNLIHVGQKINIPTKSSTPAKSNNQTASPSTPSYSTTVADRTDEKNTKNAQSGQGSVTGSSSSSGSSGSSGSSDESSSGGGTSATPNTPGSTSSGSEKPTAKAATPDLIQLNEEAFPVDAIADLMFEDLGGTEILNFARHDLVNGIDIKYHQISNLDKIESIYGASKLISLQETSEQIFSKYPLKRYKYVPNTTDDPSGFNSPLYLDADGNLIVELGGLTNSNQIEVEFQAADTNDIMY
jgi:spore coat assembly protein SafA